VGGVEDGKEVCAYAECAVLLEGNTADLRTR